MRSGLQNAQAPIAKLDAEDLEILAHRQLNGMSTLAQLSKETGVKQSTLEYHYRHHVSRQGLISRYRWDWSKVARDEDRQKGATGRGNNIGFNIIATKLDSKERMDVRAYFSQFPFFRFEAEGETFYYAEGEFPVEATNQAYEAMGEIGERLASKLEVFVRNPRNAELFGISTGVIPRKGSGQSERPKPITAIEEIVWTSRNYANGG